jgi:hypothetical protein
VVLAPIAQQAYDWLIDSGVLPDFDWVAWSAKRDLVRGNVSGLAPDVARALLTTLVLQHTRRTARCSAPSGTASSPNSLGFSARIPRWP